ncbi:hypothetical protein GQ42DRAFT_160675 [Ramicandelaber brevisporus]|nr:hypothetical protein GQ42DRAFT_160675 [Ramicandelaber brevisporus]
MTPTTRRFSSSDSAMLAEATAQFDSLKAEFAKENSDLVQCNLFLSELKLKLIQLGHLEIDPSTAAADPFRRQVLSLARDVLEVGAFWSIRAGDFDSFERYIVQLHRFYFEFASGAGASGKGNVLTPSHRMHTLVGLDLLRLLAQGRIADFHTALERIDLDAIGNSTLLQYPVNLEQQVTVGNYKKVWALREDVPAPEYLVFVDVLLDTIRAEIARCCERSYKSLPMEDAANLLFLDAQNEIAQFAHERGWTIEAMDRVIKFEANDEMTAETAYKPTRTMQQTLHYARELERII